MPTQDHTDLLEQIDRLVSDYMEAEASCEPSMIFGNDVDVEELIEHGAFPPSDRRSSSGAALWSIARRLKDDGGNTRLASVLSAYRRKYGVKRAAILNARWHYLAEQ